MSTQNANFLAFRFRQIRPRVAWVEWTPGRVQFAQTSAARPRGPVSEVKQQLLRNLRGPQCFNQPADLPAVLALHFGHFCRRLRHQERVGPAIFAGQYLAQTTASNPRPKIIIPVNLVVVFIRLAPYRASSQ